MATPQMLEPCPFCGNALDAQWTRPNPRARCCTEGCKGSQLPVLNLDVAEDIVAWNRRAQPNPPTLCTEEFLSICREELVRGTLTSIPLKFQFMRRRAFKDVEAVHEWMHETRTRFRDAVSKLSPNWESESPGCDLQGLSKPNNG